MFVCRRHQEAEHSVRRVPVGLQGRDTVQRRVQVAQGSAADAVQEQVVRPVLVLAVAGFLQDQGQPETGGGAEVPGRARSGQTEDIRVPGPTVQRRDQRVVFQVRPWR